MPTVEDYFDDETDLPLPSSSGSGPSKPRGLGGEGLHGHLLEEITSEDETDMDFSKLADQSRGEYGANSKAPPPMAVGGGNGKGKMVLRDDDGTIRPDARQGGPGIPMMNPNTPMGGFMGDMMKLQQAEEDRINKLRQQFGNAQISHDPSVYKSWNSVYPIYFDAKVSINGGRRVPRQSAIWWPQATHIAKACSSLGLQSVYEPERVHPADWENPGRVKVQFVKDGKFINPIVKNRTQLYTQIARQMQMANPSLVPRPISEASKAGKKEKSTTTATNTTLVSKKTKSGVPNATSKSKSKSKSKSSHQSAALRSAALAAIRRLPTQTPHPPQPVPDIDSRLPLHSPRVATGVAVSSVKRDSESEKEAKKKGVTGGGMSGEGGEEGPKEKQPKIKRMVIRGKR